MDELKELADEFMFVIFDFEAGEYAISDESSLFDFTGLDSDDLESIWGRIEEHYDLEPSVVSSNKLIDILGEIQGRRNPH